MSNGFEEAARIKKAVAIADLIQSRYARVERPSIALLDFVRAMPKADRDEFARQAKQHPPSDETWDLVIQTIERRTQ